MYLHTTHPLYSDLPDRQVKFSMSTFETDWTRS